MNWKRVLIYLGLVVLGTFIGGVVAGAIQGYIMASGRPDPQWTQLLQDVLVVSAILIVFIRLGRQQRDKPWKHALGVWVGGSVLSCLNVFMGESFLQIIGSIAVFALIAAVGTTVGLKRKPLPVK